MKKNAVVIAFIALFVGGSVAIGLKNGWGWETTPQEHVIRVQEAALKVERARCALHQTGGTATGYISTPPTK